MDNESQYIFQTSLIDGYAATPDSLNNLCLAEFAANYTTQSGQQLPDGETSDAVPPPEDDDSRKCKRIQLKNGLGYMYKCRQEAVIHFHRFNYEKEASKVYRSKLMLYLPWRNENADLLGGYPHFHSHYEAQCRDILANEQKFSHNATLINEAMDNLTDMDHRSMHGTKWLQEILNNKLETKLKALKKCGTLNKKTWMPMHNYFSSSQLLPSFNGLDTVKLCDFQER